MITKKTFPTIIVPIIAPTWMYAARGGEQVRTAPQADSADEREDEHREHRLVVRRTPGRARRRRATRARARRPRCAIASHAVRSATDVSTRYDRRVRVVDDDDQREAGEPRRVRLPLEPVQRLGQPLGRDAELLDAVEAAAVDLPRLAADAALRVGRVVRRLEVVVERDEVERRADPRDRRRSRAASGRAGCPSRHQ